LAFARAIRARRGRRGAGIAPVALAYRQLHAVSAPAQHFHRHTLNVALHLEPRLALTVRQRVRREPFAAWREAPLVREREPGAEPPAPGLVERIFARERRIEATTTVRELVKRVTATHENVGDAAAAPPAAPPTLVTLPAADPPMIVRRTTPQPPSAAAPPPTARTAEENGWSAKPPRLAPSRAAAVSLSPAELGRLTDEVVQAIDRRFVAHRERQGRA
jgi:hypothetical protein